MSEHIIDCPVCDKTFETEEELLQHTRQSHMQAEEEHACPFCDETYDSHEELHAHMSRMHEIISPG